MSFSLLAKRSSVFALVGLSMVLGSLFCSSSSQAIEAMVLGPYRAEKVVVPLVLSTNNSPLQAVSIKAVKQSVNVMNAYVEFADGTMISASNLLGRLSDQNSRSMDINDARPVRALRLEVVSDLIGARGEFEVYAQVRVDQPSYERPNPSYEEGRMRRGRRRHGNPGFENPAPTYDNGSADRGSYRERESRNLAGYCADYDHREFVVAKNFAYSSSGLNYTSTESVRWAQGFVTTHFCGAIKIFQTRYQAIYRAAYDQSGLDMSSTDARAYALSKVEMYTNLEAEDLVKTIKAVRSFAYNTNGLDLSSIEAQKMARSWVDRGNCESADFVQEIANRYRQEYQFAYSTSGLNYNSIEARRYAVRSVRTMSRCGDLFARAVN